MGDRLNATVTGQKVLAGLNKGRAIAIQRKRDESARKLMLIVIAVNADRASGKPVRGLAGRISRRLQGQISERLVRKYLATLYSGADSLGQDGGTQPTEVYR